jgi:hypothetical protein
MMVGRPLGLLGLVGKMVCGNNRTPLGVRANFFRILHPNYQK